MAKANPFQRINLRSWGILFFLAGLAAGPTLDLAMPIEGRGRKAQAERMGRVAGQVALSGTGVILLVVDTIRRTGKRADHRVKG